MRKVLGLLSRLALVATVFVVLAMIYSTAEGYTVWYFRVPGSVVIDGRKSGGYMHANTQRNILLITRTDGSRPETYLVPKFNRTILDCGAWHPIRFLPVPVGDLHPPCSVLNTEPENVIDPPIGSTLVRTGRSVEFSTASGKKIKAEW